MEALMASYGSDSDDSSPSTTAPAKDRTVLPPPPVDLLQPPNALLDFLSTAQGSRLRSFPHIKGNYALHVYIPVVIPSTIRKQIALAVKKIASLVPNLSLVDIDVTLSEICKDDNKLEQLLRGRVFHISLGRTVPIQVHQIDSILTMLRQKFHSQGRYSIEFNKWDVFVNDDQTRSFFSLEVAGGLFEISRQIHIVDEIYRLHGLPEFYKNPRPHISLVWALGDISYMLKQAAEEVNKFCNSATSSLRKPIFMYKFGGIECKIGKTLYTICRFPEK